MTSKFVSGERVIIFLGAAMVVCLPLTIVTFVIALIWNGQPFGNTATTIADVFASAFSVAFFAAFVLKMVEERTRHG